MLFVPSVGVRVALGTIFCSQAESNCQLEGQSLLCCRYTMRTELPPGFDPGMPDAESNVITDFTTEAERLLGIEPSLPRTQHGVLPLTLQPRTLEL